MYCLQQELCMQVEESHSMADALVAALGAQLPPGSRLVAQHGDNLSWAIPRCAI